MNPSRLAIAAVLIVAALALGTRVIALDARPMHGDEANQAHKTGRLIDEGEYRYDPHEHHGPTLYYFALASAALRGESTFAETHDATYRIVPVIFSVLAIVLLLCVRDGLGNGGVVWAAIFAAVSPAAVFYSRYFIQETLLVCFTFALIAFGWRFYRSGRIAWAIAAGFAAGLMHATKETCIIAFAAMAGALVLTFLLGKWRPVEDAAVERPTPDLLRKSSGSLALPITIAVVVAIGTSIVFFSSFFTHPRGVLDSVLTYASYVGRGAADEAQPGGAEWHRHPWNYYVSMLAYTKMPFGPVWTEGLILGLAAAGAAFAILRRNATPLARFLVFYTALVIAAYSLIPYKTPWNVLTMLHGCTLLAGYGAASIIRLARFLPVRGAVVLALLAGAYHLGQQAVRANGDFNADPRNPYVYAHTSSAAVALVERVEALAVKHPDGKKLLVRVILPNGDYWPLPYYLRDFEKVGYWSRIPEDVDAPIIITAPAYQETFVERFGDAYELSHFSLRPGVILLMFVEHELWESFMADRR